MAENGSSISAGRCVPEYAVTEKLLGSGIFGEVVVVTCIHTRVEYAAKIWQNKTYAYNTTIPVVEEKISNIRHANITQFIGFLRMEGSNLPAIVMEKLDMNLHQLMSTSSNLLLSLKLSISEDVCSGLTYLHSRQPPIIHGDLISRNILLTTDLSAKISDMWNHMVMDMKPKELASLFESQQSSELDYLPVHDLITAEKYSTSLDMFSLGKVMLYLVSHPHSDSAKSDCMEDLMNSKHIEKQSGRHFHEISQIISNCLLVNANLRPACSTVLDVLRKVNKCMEKDHGKRKNCLLHLWGASISDQGPDCSSEQTKTIISLQEENKSLRRLLMPSEGNSECSLEEAHFPPAKEEMGPRSAESLRRKEADKTLPLQLKWTEEEHRMPFRVSRYIQVIELDGVLYIGGGETEITHEFKVMVYDLSSKKWSTLAGYFAKFFAMAVVNQKLTLVGGCDKDGEVVNSITTWDKHEKWKYLFEPMPTSRSHCSAVTYKKWLVVAGGTTAQAHQALNITEVLDTDTNQWYRGPDTPGCWYSMRSVCIGTTWYLMGGHFLIRNVISASLDNLVSQERCTKAWKELRSLHSIYSTPVVMGKHLLAVCGRRYAYKSEDGIYMYNEDRNQWELAGRMPSAVCNCACVIVSGIMYMFGGHDGESAQNSVYSAPIYPIS